MQFGRTSPQRFHYYFNLSIVSWQYQKCKSVFLHDYLAGSGPSRPSRRSQDQICSGKKSRFSNLNFFSDFMFPNPFYCVHSSGLWSGFINPPLQSLVNQCFLQTFERLFSKKKTERRSLWLNCNEMPKIWRENPLKWVVSISRDYWVYFDITWKISKN